MKWVVLSMSVISTVARLTARAATVPPNPPRMIRTRGRAGGSGKSLLERSGSECHEKHQEYQQHAVRGRGPESQCAELSENLHRDRPVRMRIEYHTRHKFTDRGHRSEQSARDE